jgi:ribosomal protein L34E
VKRWWVALLAVVVAALGAWLLRGESAVRQPIEFPHKTHLELKESKLQCTSCHERAEKGMMAGRPSTKKCLSCHSEGEAKSAEEKKLKAFGEKGQEIEWRRVWRLPSHVFFSHRIHVAAAKIKCQRCHGPMETLDRPPPRALKKLTMADCIGCHETWQWPDETANGETGPRKVALVRTLSNDCGDCHR